MAVLGDIDGDGYDDFLVGQPYSGADILDGAALLLYGGPNRLPARIASSEVDVTFHAPNDEVLALGIAVAMVGDLDADGFGDFVVGAPWGDDNAGFLYYGRAQRWGGLQDVFEADTILDGPVLSGAGPPITTAGDINGDGFDDFLIGDTGLCFGPDYSGFVYLVLGSS